MVRIASYVDSVATRECRHYVAPRTAGLIDVPWLVRIGLVASCQNAMLQTFEASDGRIT